MYGPCLTCGHDYYDHRTEDMACPRVKPHIAGIVNTWDYMSGTTYTPQPTGRVLGEETRKAGD